MKVARLLDRIASRVVNGLKNRNRNISAADRKGVELSFETWFKVTAATTRPWSVWKYIFVKVNPDQNLTILCLLWFLSFLFWFLGLGEIFLLSNNKSSFSFFSWMDSDITRSFCDWYCICSILVNFADACFPGKVVGGEVFMHFPLHFQDRRSAEDTFTDLRGKSHTWLTLPLSDLGHRRQHGFVRFLRIPRIPGYPRITRS